MFQVKIEDKLFDVTFEHRFYQDVLPNSEWYSKNIRARTTCAIEQHDIAFGGFGAAYCSVHDQFDKNKGRKLSLTRALQEFTKDKTIRKLFWDQYFSIHGGH